MKVNNYIIRIGIILLSISSCSSEVIEDKPLQSIESLNPLFGSISENYNATYLYYCDAHILSDEKQCGCVIEILDSITVYSICSDSNSLVEKIHVEIPKEIKQNFFKLYNTINLREYDDFNDVNLSGHRIIKDFAIRKNGKNVYFFRHDYLKFAHSKLLSENAKLFIMDLHSISSKVVNVQVRGQVGNVSE